MKLIAITTEQLFEGEAAIINRLFEEGLEVLHLRKPTASVQDIRRMLTQIEMRFHHRIVLHDHFVLTEEFALKGVHLNRRNPVATARNTLSVSKSCHSMAELTDVQAYRYVFLSPIFNSISKSGYHKAFTDEELYAAQAEGLISSNVYALGGVSAAEVPLAARYGFGGVVVLGALWGDYLHTKDTAALLKRWKNLAQLCHNY